MPNFRQKPSTVVDVLGSRLPLSHVCWSHNKWHQCITKLHPKVMGVFFNVLILKSCVRVYVYVCVCECRCPQKLEESESLEMELQAVVRHPTRLLETEHGSSARALLVLPHQVFSTAPRSVLKLEICVSLNHVCSEEADGWLRMSIRCSVTTDQTKTWT